MLKGRKVPLFINHVEVGKAYISAGGTIEIISMTEPNPLGQALLEQIHTDQAQGLSISVEGNHT